MYIIPHLELYLSKIWGTNAKPSIGANKHTSQHRNGVSAAAGAPGTDAATDVLAAVGVNCSSSSSSSELSACWLGCSASVWAPTAWLTARRNCSVSYPPLSNRDTHALHCCYKSLKQYPYNFECGIRYVFGFVREIITCRAHSFAFTWSYAVYTLCRSTPLFSVRHFPVLQIPPLRLRPSFSTPANSSPANSAIPFWPNSAYHEYLVMLLYNHYRIVLT